MGVVYCNLLVKGGAEFFLEGDRFAVTNEEEAGHI